MLKNIMSVIVLVLSMNTFVIAYFQFKNKGMLLNNAYLYASAKERKGMDKKPYYRQSAIAFSIIGLMLLLTALAMITDTSALINIVIGLAISLVVYVIISTVRIETKQKRKN